MKRRELLAAALALLPLGALSLGRRPRLRLGCAVITWGDDDPQAISDIAALG